MRWALPLLVACPLLAAAPAGDLDTLFNELRAASSEDDARELEKTTQQALLDRAGPSAKLLIARGLRDLQANAHADALEDFDAVVTLDPDLAEGWHQRAVARHETGDSAGAIADIAEALKREPRDFAALTTLSHVAQDRGDWKGAWHAWQRVLELDPMTPDGQRRLNELRRHAIGEET